MENSTIHWPSNQSWAAGSCLSPLRDVDWTDAAILASFIVLGVINILVIGGNTLVIMAVFLHSKLRSVTNLFIVSLAVADLLVGVVVLPFSTTYEVLNFWVFGDIWCTIWLAVDVLLCTASILNLCAISLDRFLAVTRPVSYPSLMSSRRAKGLIAAVWCVSFVISLPPLLGWNDTGSTLTKPSHIVPAPLSPDVSVVTATKKSTLSEPFANYDAAATGRSYGYGGNTSNVAANVTLQDSVEITENWVMPNGTNLTGDYMGGEEDGVTEGTGVVTNHPQVMGCQCQLISDRGYRIYSALGSFYLPMLVMMFFYWRIYKAAVETTRAINQGFKTTTMGGRFDEQRLTLRIHRGRSSADFYGKTNGTCSSSTGSTQTSFRTPRHQQSGASSPASSTSSSTYRGGKTLKPSVSFPPSSAKRKMRNGSKVPKRKSDVSDSTPSKNSARHQWLMVNHARCGRGLASGVGAMSDAIMETEVTLADNGDADADGNRRENPVCARMGKRNIKAQVKRFRMETKAAKTLGIIVGGFILCWLPFFTFYLIGAFCDDDCIPESLFSVFFWLGYCNSAINPCVYALFSRDFRYAFKKILCKCTLRDDVSIKERIVTMFPPTIHLSSFGEESEGGSDSH